MISVCDAHGIVRCAPSPSAYFEKHNGVLDTIVCARCSRPAAYALLGAAAGDPW
jgi:hypothetical protein